MSYVEDQLRDNDEFFEFMEREERATVPPEVQPGWELDVRKAFAGPELYIAPEGVLYGSDMASAVVRAAQYGQAEVLDALAAADPECFAVVFADERSDMPTDLLAQALKGFWITSERFGNTFELAHRYYAAVLALLRGGASPRITSEVSLFMAWPVVMLVHISSGIRLEGWASRGYERRCWDWLEGFNAGKVVTAPEGDGDGAASAAIEDAEAVAI